jgi:hypothetical protein
MTHLRSITIATIAIIFLIIPFSPERGHAATGNGTVKIGHITYSNGQVLVRSKGKWMILKNTPFPLYSTDRVVTKSGRTSINLVDGGVIRMNVDTSLRIIRRTGSKGFIRKSKYKATEVNVLVGDVWFDIELKKEKTMSFRTPSMTAAIRGTEGNIQVTLDSQSNLDLKSGKTKNSGEFTREPRKSDAKSGTELVASSPKFLNSRLIRAVDSALESQETADNEIAKAIDLKTKADTLQKKNNGGAAKALVKYSLSKSSAFEAQARANLAAIAEEMDFAEHMGDGELLTNARDSNDSARRYLNEAVERNEETRSMAESIGFTSRSSKLTSALSHVVSTLADATAIKAEIVRAYTYISIAHAAGNSEDARFAESYAKKAINISPRIDALRLTMSSLVQEISAGLENGKAKAILTASLAASKVASVHAAAAAAQANAAMEIMSGDSNSATIAFKASDMAEMLSNKGEVLTRNLVFLVTANEQDILDETLIKGIRLEEQALGLSNGGVTPEVLPPDIEEPEPEVPTPEGPEEDLEWEWRPEPKDTGTGDRNVSPYKP